MFFASLANSVLELDFSYFFFLISYFYFWRCKGNIYKFKFRLTKCYLYVKIIWIYFRIFAPKSEICHEETWNSYHRSHGIAHRGIHPNYMDALFLCVCEEWFDISNDKYVRRSFGEWNIQQTLSSACWLFRLRQEHGWNISESAWIHLYARVVGGIGTSSFSL